MCVHEKANEVINDTVMFITDELTAKKLLKRNPRAKVIKGQNDDERFALVYHINDCNLMNGVKKHDPRLVIKLFMYCFCV